MFFNSGGIFRDSNLFLKPKYKRQDQREKLLQRRKHKKKRRHNYSTGWYMSFRHLEKIHVSTLKKASPKRRFKTQTKNQRLHILVSWGGGHKNAIFSSWRAIIMKHSKIGSKFFQFKDSKIISSLCRLSVVLLKILSMPTRLSPNESGDSTYGRDVPPVPSAWLRGPAWIPCTPCERHELFVHGDAYLHIMSGIIHTPFLSPQSPLRKPKNLLRHSVVTLINLVWFLAIRQSRHSEANQQSLFKCWIWLS